MKIQIDCYGFEATSEHFQKRKLEAFLIKNDAGIVYACFGTGERRAIHRIDKDPDGCVRVMWAYGKWEEGVMKKALASPTLPPTESMNSTPPNIATSESERLLMKLTKGPSVAP